MKSLKILPFLSVFRDWWHWTFVSVADSGVRVPRLALHAGHRLTNGRRVQVPGLKGNGIADVVGNAIFGGEWRRARRDHQPFRAASDVIKMLWTTYRAGTKIPRKFRHS